MRCYFEYRSNINDKCIRPDDLDLIVCKFFNIKVNVKEYVIPPHNENINWFDIIMGLLWLLDFNDMDGHCVTMESLIIALKKNQSCFCIQEVKPYILLFKLFEVMDLYLYVAFLETSFFDKEAFKPYQTINPDKIYTKEEVVSWADFVPDYECLKKVYESEILNSNI